MCLTSGRPMAYSGLLLCGRQFDKMAERGFFSASFSPRSIALLINWRQGVNRQIENQKINHKCVSIYNQEDKIEQKMDMGIA